MHSSTAGSQSFGERMMQSISMVPFLSLCFNRQMAVRALVHLCGLLRCAGGVRVRPKTPPNMRTRLATSVFTKLQQSSNYASASDHRQRPCGHIQSIFAHWLDTCPSTPFYQHLCIQALPTSQRESPPERHLSGADTQESWSCALTGLSTNSSVSM